MRLSIAAIALARTILPASGMVLSARGPDNVTVTSVAYSGTGCPNGTVSTLIGENLAPNLAVDVGFDNFLVYWDPSKPDTSMAALGCEIVFAVNYPAGTTAQNVHVAFRGQSVISSPTTNATLSYALSFGVGTPAVTFWESDVTRANDEWTLSPAVAYNSGHLARQTDSTVTVTAELSVPSGKDGDPVDGDYTVLEFVDIAFGDWD